MIDLLAAVGVAVLAALVHATISLGLVRLAFGRFRLSPAAREWMLRGALVLPLVMAGRSLAQVLPGDARLRAALNEFSLHEADLAVGGKAAYQGTERVQIRSREQVFDGEALRQRDGIWRAAVGPGDSGMAEAGMLGGEPRTSRGEPVLQARRVVMIVDDGAAGSAVHEAGRETPAQAGPRQWESLEREVTILPGRAAWLEWALPFAALIWMLGTLVQLGRAARSGLAVRRLVTGSLPADPELVGEVEALGRSAGIVGVRPRILEGLGSPFAVSGGRLILPDWIVTLPRARRQAILIHEIAHLKRHDPVAQRFLVLVRAALWPHPLLAWAMKEMRRAVEHRCDDAAIEGTDRMTFARALAEVAERLHASRSVPPTGHLAVSGAPISDRVARALNGDRGGKVWIAVAGVTLLAALTVLLPPTDPGPEYDLRVVQTHQIVRDLSRGSRFDPVRQGDLLRLPGAPRSGS